MISMLNYFKDTLANEWLREDWLERDSNMWLGSKKIALNVSRMWKKMWVESCQNRESNKAEETELNPVENLRFDRVWETWVKYHQRISVKSSWNHWILWNYKCRWQGSCNCIRCSNGRAFNVAVCLWRLWQRWIFWDYRRSRRDRLGCTGRMACNGATKRVPGGCPLYKNIG